MVLTQAFPSLDVEIILRIERFKSFNCAGRAELRSGYEDLPLAQWGSSGGRSLIIQPYVGSRER